MKTAMKMIEERLRVGSAWSRGSMTEGGEEEEADEQLLAFSSFSTHSDGAAALGQGVIVLRGR